MYHFMTYLLFILIRLSCFAYVESTTNLLVLSNPNQSKHFPTDQVFKFVKVVRACPNELRRLKTYFTEVRRNFYFANIPPSQF